MQRPRCIRNKKFRFLHPHDPATSCVGHNFVQRWNARSDCSARGDLMSSATLSVTEAAERFGAEAVFQPLPWSTKLLYGAPSFAGAAMIIPIFIPMPKF